MLSIKGCLQASLNAKVGSNETPTIEAYANRISVIIGQFIWRYIHYDKWKESLNRKANVSWNLHSALPSQINAYEDTLARYHVSKGEKAESLELGAMLNDGVQVGNTWFLDRVLTYGALEPINHETYLEILDYYCNPSLPLLSITQSQDDIGLGAGGSSELEIIDYSRSPMLYPLALQNSRQAAPMGGADQANYLDILVTSASLDETGEIVVQAIVNKLVKSLPIMQDYTSID